MIQSLNIIASETGLTTPPASLLDINTLPTTISKCGWTPFDGYTGYGKIETTIVNGKIVYNRDQIIENTGSEIEYE